MSKSRKSELSPSITKGSNAIDLGKNSGVDMGQKSQPSITSGGIGITQEVTNVGGLSVSAGANIDITPIDFGVNINPSEGTISVATEAELPGGLLGISGGIEIDTNTGEIIGGSIGGEVGGLGINVSSSEKGGLGIELTVQIPGTPIELSLGFGFPPKEPTPTPTPTLPGTDNPDASKPPTLFPEPIYPIPTPGKHCTVYFGINILNWAYLPYENKVVLEKFQEFGSYDFVRGKATHRGIGDRKTTNLITGEVIIEPFNYPERELAVSHATTISPVYLVSRTYYRDVHATSISGLEENIYKFIKLLNLNRQIDNGVYGKTINQAVYTILASNCSTPSPTPSPNPSPTPSPSPSPFPNPPPRRRNKMDECCQISIRLQRLIVRHLGAVTGSNQETLPNGVRAIGSIQDGIPQAYPFAVKKQWVDPNAKEDENISILNDRHLALVLGGMIERLERVLGTAEFYKDSDKKLRQSEGNMLSWLTGKNNDFRYPDPNDFWLNTDDGIINEKTLEVRSIADGLRYQIEALNRLERILPIAELKDSSIPARWIYPNGKGQLRVGNLIHLCEYMIRKSDKDMGYWPQTITLKAKNPAIEEDEAITTDVHSQADMLRVILQQLLDVEGDGDMGSNYDLRRTYLDVMAFQMLAKNNKYLQAITEYLSFDMTEEVSKIPIPFDPFAGQDRSIIEDWWIKFGFGEEKLNLPTKNTESEIERLSEGLLQNSELEVNTVKFGSLDERKEPKTLKETLLEISKNSSASAAAVTEVASEGALERVVEAAGLAQKLTSFLMRRDVRESLGIGDLDNWISSAEKGYTDDAGTESLRFPESDPFEPYGRPTTQNPVIREIDTKKDEAD